MEGRVGLEEQMSGGSREWKENVERKEREMDEEGLDFSSLHVKTKTPTDLQHNPSTSVSFPLPSQYLEQYW